jgi:hypothetical protein
LVEYLHRKGPRPDAGISFQEKTTFTLSTNGIATTLAIRKINVLVHLVLLPVSNEMTAEKTAAQSYVIQLIARAPLGSTAMSDSDKRRKASPS